MIKLGTENELSKVSHLDIKMCEQIRKCVTVLDYNYGAYRDVDHSLGGFVVVIENEADKELIKQYNLDLDRDIAEYVDEYDGFTESLYLISDDFSVIVFKCYDK